MKKKTKAKPKPSPTGATVDIDPSAWTRNVSTLASTSNQYAGHFSCWAHPIRISLGTLVSYITLYDLRNFIPCHRSQTLPLNPKNNLIFFCIVIKWTVAIWLLKPEIYVYLNSSAGDSELVSSIFSWLLITHLTIRAK